MGVIVKSPISFVKLAVLLVAALASFNGHARDSSDGGCTESDGTWTCTGDPIVVIGVPPDDGGMIVDSFSCRKNPQNCLPVPPPRPGTSAADTGGVGPGRGPSPKELESTNLAALRAADCGELDRKSVV